MLMSKELTRLRGKNLIGKTLISDETGSKFGKVGDVIFIGETGELVSVVLVEPTKLASDLQLQTDESGRLLIPFSAIKSVGDYVIVSEKDIF